MRMIVPIIEKLTKLVSQNQTEFVAFDLGASYVKGIYVEDNTVKSCIVEKNKGEGARQAIDWLQKESLFGKEIRLGIKGPDTLVRYIPFPKVEKKKLKEIFAYEVSKFIPFKPEEVYFDVSIINDNYSKNEFFLLLASAKRDHLNATLGQFSEKKIPVTTINLNNVALINLYLAAVSSGTGSGVEEKADTKEQNDALIDIGMTSTLLNLVRAGQPCLSREIKLSTGNLIEQIAKEKNISPEDAEKAVCGLILSGKEKDAGLEREILEEFIQALAEEVKSSFDYFEVNWGSRVQRLYLTGGLSKISGIDTLIEKNLNIPSLIFNPAEGSRLTYGTAVAENKEQLSVALGLAL